MKKGIGIIMAGVILATLITGCKNDMEDPNDMEGKAYYTTWASSQYLAESYNQPPMELSGNSIRQVVHASVGGSVIRVKFSNLVGDETLKIGEAHIALSKQGPEINTNTDTKITFGGKPNCEIAAGKEIWSDNIAFSFDALDCLTVSTYFEKVPTDITGHMGSRTNSYMMSGNHVGEKSFSINNKCEHWYVLAAIDVVSAEKIKVVSCLGDSITDGRGSTTDLQNRWTDVLSERVLKNKSTKNVAVINEGIGGTCVMFSGVERFDRDVLGNSGAAYAIMLYGINDIIYVNATSEAVINVYKQLIEKAHAADVIIYGATILPFGNCGDYSDGKNQVRIEVNNWIKNTSKEDGGFDAVVDLDTIMADSKNPNKMNKAYDCGDGLHPSAAGYQKIGEAFDLSLFTK